MTKIVCIDLEVHKTNLPEAMDMAIKSQSKKIVFVGLNVELVQQAFEAGREVVVLPVGAPLPEGAVAVPFFPGTERSRAFIHAQKFKAAQPKIQ